LSPVLLCANTMPSEGCSSNHFFDVINTESDITFQARVTKLLHRADDKIIWSFF
jgi:hypothetical protein